MYFKLSDFSINKIDNCIFITKLTFLGWLIMRSNSMTDCFTGLHNLVFKKIGLLLVLFWVCKSNGTLKTIRWVKREKLNQSRTINDDAKMDRVILVLKYRNRTWMWKYHKKRKKRSYTNWTLMTCWRKALTCFRQDSLSRETSAIHC